MATVSFISLDIWLLSTVVLPNLITKKLLLTLEDLFALIFGDLSYLRALPIVLNGLIRHLLVQIATPNEIVIHQFDILRCCVRVNTFEKVMNLSVG